jgi:hypothetical protein
LVFILFLPFPYFSFSAAQIVSFQHPDLLERYCGMATLAIPAEIALMNIVFPVTAGTGFPHLDLVFDWFSVTGETFQRLMGAVKPELGLRVVVILPEVPAVRVVAIGTVIAKMLFVRIILFVTVNAVAGGILEGRSAMTAFAGRDRMQSDQRETGQVMLETHICPPAALVVTTFTILSLLSPMSVVQAMTAVTVERQLFPFHGAGVAFVAGHFGVLVAQREFGLGMVKLGLFPAFGFVAVVTFVAIAATMQIFSLMT